VGRIIARLAARGCRWAWIFAGIAAAYWKILSRIKALAGGRQPANFAVDKHNLR
jgi:hypothetical protein